MTNATTRRRVQQERYGIGCMRQDVCRVCALRRHVEQGKADCPKGCHARTVIRAHEKRISHYIRTQVVEVA